MAADRQRLAQALAAEAARRKMFESIPEAAGQELPQAPEATNYGRDLENLSIGLGRGAVNQLEGLKGLVTSPVESLKGMATGAMEAVRNPRMIAEALKRQGERAISGPLGLGEVIGENVNIMRMPGKPVMSELDVYHGTPHRFPATEANPLGEFDASKIGTGEGAQAYGHGIYYAESPEVAKGYKTRLSNSSYIDSASQTQKSSGDVWMQAQKAVQEAGESHPDRAGQIASDVQEWVDSGRSAKTFLKYRQVSKGLEPAYQAAMDAFGAAKKNSGSLYKADLPDEMIDRMLDWDKPIRKQPKAIQEIARKIIAENLDWSDPKAKAIDEFYDATGADLYQALEGKLGSRETSNYFKQAGLPGVRYLDAGSRGAGGTGTRNFVVFPGEEKKVRILERK